MPFAVLRAVSGRCPTARNASHRLGDIIVMMVAASLCAASPPLTVSAFATEVGLCLAAAAPSTDENEIEAALRVVELIDLTDKIVTADALHCHRRMAQAILDRGGNYILALKETAATGVQKAREPWPSPTR